MVESANKSVKTDCVFFFYGMKYAEICTDRLSTSFWSVLCASTRGDLQTFVINQKLIRFL